MYNYCRKVRKVLAPFLNFPVGIIHRHVWQKQNRLLVLHIVLTSRLHASHVE